MNLDLAKKDFKIGRAVVVNAKIPDPVLVKFDRGLPKKGVIVEIVPIAHDLLGVGVQLEQPIAGVEIPERYADAIRNLRTFVFDARDVDLDFYSGSGLQI